MYRRTGKLVLIVFLGITLLKVGKGNTVQLSQAIGKVPENLIAVSPQAGGAIIVEKNTQTLFYYSVVDKDIYLPTYKFPCSTGEAKGPKKKSGDKKTPEGIYFFINDFEEKYLSPIYGSRAFPTDYPNHMDQLAGKNGTAIWLHGTNKPLRPRDSNGCIALANPSIDQLADHIKLHQTPIIIVDKIKTVPMGSLSGLRHHLEAFIDSWKKALIKGTYHEYLDFYDSSYLPELGWWEEWRDLAASFQNIKPPITLKLASPSFYQHNNLYVILFDEILQAGDREVPGGKRKLFIRNTGNGLRIIGDEFQASPEDKKRYLTHFPLLVAAKTLKAKSERDQGIARMVKDWARAWSDGDMATYGQYYAQNFRANGKNKNSWIRYKKRINEKYKYINVSIKDLVIDEGKNKSTATFIQTYVSSGYRAVGVKCLELILEGGEWKIYREKWRRS